MGLKEKPVDEATVPLSIHSPSHEHQGAFQLAVGKLLVGFLGES